MPHTLTLVTAIVTITFAAFLASKPFSMTSKNTVNHPWAEGPCTIIRTPQFLTKKDDIWTRGATHMALLHNAILRGFNSIYIQALHVKPEDYNDFVGYSVTWYRFVKSHHDDEEAELFPKVDDILKEQGIWDETHKEHGNNATILVSAKGHNADEPTESFIEGLTDFHAYLSTLSSTTAFNGAKLVAIMDSFRGPFTHHFHHEISIIASFADLPSAPPADSPEAAAAASTFRAWGKKTLTKAGMTDVVPFALFNLDRTFEDGLWSSWPPMPAPVRWMMVNMFGSWNWGWWKFASCDSQGNPRPLYALPNNQRL